METAIRAINIILLAGISFFFLALAATSIRERRYRAAAVAGLFLALNCAFWLLMNSGLDLAWVRWVNIAAVVLIAALGAVSIIKFFPGEKQKRNPAAALRYDERDNMFSRNNLRHYPELMEEYYRDKPEKAKIDKEIHGMPEFGEPGHTYYHRYAAPVYQAAFEYIERTIPVSQGEPAEEKKEIDPAALKKFITDAAVFYGACDVGFARLKSYHLYSHRGRHAESWGEEVATDHKSAIVIALRMDPEMILSAPTGTVIQESFRKYVEAAKVSDIIAAYIRSFGYRARAHNDANYQTLCVPLAVDAGMGELGRLGVLIHYRYGPLVRLAVVTTELELEAGPSQNQHIGDFCVICRKCSDNCPTSAISSGEEPESRGFRHWSIEQEKCYRFWKRIGTDCGVCLAVCPYSKPDSLMHRLVRFYISRNRLNQRMALLFDDLMYGRRKKISQRNPENLFNTG